MTSAAPNAIMMLTPTHSHSSRTSSEELVGGYGNGICARSGISAFPWKLHDILEESERMGFTDIVSWTMQDRGFRVHNHVEFEQSVMKRYFHGRYKSFQRQLNIYGFQRVNTGDDAGSYTHPCFIRGKPDQCRFMVRSKIKGRCNGAYGAAIRHSAGDKLERTEHGSSCSNNNSSHKNVNLATTIRRLPNELSLLAFVTSKRNPVGLVSDEAANETRNHLVNRSSITSMATNNVYEKKLVFPSPIAITESPIDVPSHGSPSHQVMDCSTKIEGHTKIEGQLQHYQHLSHTAALHHSHHQMRQDDGTSDEMGERRAPRNSCRRRSWAETYLQYSIALQQQQEYYRHRRSSLSGGVVNGDDDEDLTRMDLDNIFDEVPTEDRSTTPQAYYDPLAVEGASPSWCEGGKVPSSMAEELLRHMMHW